MLLKVRSTTETGMTRQAVAAYKLKEHIHEIWFKCFESALPLGMTSNFHLMVSINDKIDEFHLTISVN